jgi:hypothetical protein
MICRQPNSAIKSGVSVEDAPGNLAAATAKVPSSGEEMGPQGN